MNPGIQALPLPESRDPHSLLEWAEMVMLVEEIDDLSKAEIQNRFVSGERPPAEDAEAALRLASVRATHAPSVYPFRLAGDRLLLAGHADADAEAVEICPYLFLRVVGLQDAPWVQEGQAARAGSYLDYLARDALLDMMGDGTCAVIFGAPARDGRPGGLPKAVTWLAEVMGLPDGDKDRPPDSQDAGVDLVVWKPEPDGRSGIPVWLVQASAEHEVVKKASIMIPVDGWRRWIKFGAGLTTAFATAHSVPKGSTIWMELNDRHGVVLDRHRICVHLSRHLEVVGAFDWPAEVCSFAEAQLAAIRYPPEGQRPTRTRRRKRERRSDHADPKAR